MALAPDLHSGMLAALDRFEQRVLAILDASRDDFFEIARRVARDSNCPSDDHAPQADDYEDLEVATPEELDCDTDTAEDYCEDTAIPVTPKDVFRAALFDTAALPTCNVIGKVARATKGNAAVTRPRIPPLRLSEVNRTPQVLWPRKPPDKF